MTHSKIRMLLVVHCICFLAGMALFLRSTMSVADSADSTPVATYSLSKRTAAQEGNVWKRSIANVQWEPERVAVIICDVWDYHHSINAVRRLDEMLPRMNALVSKMRAAGSLVIHAPSDCMPHYAEHPARRRAVSIPKRDLPAGIASWNCKLERELTDTYPLDQSDGGEDDDPEEHKAWAAKLSSVGRNPSLPWGSQNPGITIDSTADYISDRGEEVWAILRQHQIEHVVMIGVHTNMCVLGRPFGLRQWVNQGIDVVLVRDLTDCMYNPNRWPYVDHYSGNDLMITYIEHVVCPTITSDQILGGQPVVFSQDLRDKKDLLPHQVATSKDRDPAWSMIAWKTVASQWLAPLGTANASRETIEPKFGMLRCSLRVPPSAFDKPVVLIHPKIQRAWLNGHTLPRAARPEGPSGFELRAEHTFGNDDANVLVIELDSSLKSQIPSGPETTASPMVFVGDRGMTMGGDWQWKPEPTLTDTNLPLPAKFALPPAVFYSVDSP